LCRDGVLLRWFLKQPWIRFFIDLITHDFLHSIQSWVWASADMMKFIPLYVPPTCYFQMIVI
jgi:hypothetical protein